MRTKIVPPGSDASALQYMGLTVSYPTTSDAECRAKCCAAGVAKCNVWLRLEQDPTSSYPLGTCFIGIAQGGSVHSPAWSGERIGNDPPPPPPPAPPAGVPTDLSQQYVPVPLAASGPVQELDLASDSSWTASVDGAASRPIIVPGGGYNSDMQPEPWIDVSLHSIAHNPFGEDGCVLTSMVPTPRLSTCCYQGYNEVQDNVTYVRKLVGLHAHFVKAVTGPVLLEFGGVAHGAEVYLTPIKSSSCNVVPGVTSKVAQHWGPMMPFAADVSKMVRSGCDFELTVVAHHFRKLSAVLGVGFIYNEYVVATRYHCCPIQSTIAHFADPSLVVDPRRPWTNRSQWQSRNAFGITKSVRLAAYNMTALTDIVTHTSVKKSTFGFDAVLANFGTTRQVFTVSATVTPWGNGTTAANAQPIVAVPAQRVTLDPGQNETVQVRDVAWQLGNESFWWPNKPFHEDYTPKLHVLALSVTSSSGEVAATASHRFGFVEWSEAPNNRTWYTVNGRRINFISDATPEAAMSTYDCYTTSPAFNTLEGAKETWRRYMRIGMSANRIHQSTPTQIMMDAADEVGFALQPETAIRGECPVDRETGALPSGYTDAVKELARLSRSHPSVFSYSLQNECDPNSIPALLDAISEVDTDRPFVWNDNHLGQPTRMVGRTNGSQHAYAMLHYRTLGCDSSHSFAGGICMQESMLTGLGECAWCIEEGLESYSAIVVEARQYDIAYIAGWDWMCVLLPIPLFGFSGYPT